MSKPHHSDLALSSAFSFRRRRTRAAISGGHTASLPCSRKSIRSAPESPKASAQLSKLPKGGLRFPRMTREMMDGLDLDLRENSRRVQPFASMRPAKLSPNDEATGRAYVLGLDASSFVLYVASVATLPSPRFTEIPQ
jgi:hypothetical protein